LHAAQKFENYNTAMIYLLQQYSRHFLSNNIATAHHQMELSKDCMLVFRYIDDLMYSSDIDA